MENDKTSSLKIRERLKLQTSKKQGAFVKVIRVGLSVACPLSTSIVLFLTKNWFTDDEMKISHQEDMAV